MIGGEFNTPADWLRTGNAAAIVDSFAQSHGGNAPVLVFVDSGGSFNNDTECVNGARGNVADHLTKDVVPYVNATLRHQLGKRRLGHRRLVDGRHLRGRPDRDASRTVQPASSTSRATRDPTRAPRTRRSPGSTAAARRPGRSSTRRP